MDLRFWLGDDFVVRLGVWLGWGGKMAVILDLSFSFVDG